MFRAVLVLAALAGPAQAGTMLVIDDFTDPAVVIDRGEVITPGVGDLSADRRLRGSVIGAGDPTAHLEIADGHYHVDVDDAGGSVFYAYTYYDFPTTDLSQFDAVVLDISQWTDPPADPMALSFPSLRIAFEVDEGLPGTKTLLIRRIRDISPGRLVVPLDTFTNRGGGAFDPILWSSINQMWVQVGTNRTRGPWDVTFDRFALGHVIPEPSSLACFATALLGWSFLYHRLRRRKHVSDNCFGGHRPIVPGDVPGDRRAEW